jgi:predicted DNA-binding ribbon-helix-helix protein
MEDNRVDVPIELTDDDWYTLMKMAHERDITLNQLVEEILTLEINRQEKEQS